MRNLLAFVVFAFAYGISTAHATCTEPSGAYVGSGAGFAYDQTTGALLSGGAQSVSLSVRFGAKTITAMGKQLGATGPFKNTTTITSVTFDPTTCLGTVTLSGGAVYAYSSANSGNTITFDYYSNDNVLQLWTIVLQRE
jgi:hypothetical protein